MAQGLAFVRWHDEKPNCSFAKFLPEGKLDEILSHLGCEKGDVVLIVADKNKVTLPVLGALRLEVAKKLDLIPAGKFNFLWITQFPFFEWNEDTQHWDAMHHPFTMPMDECLPIWTAIRHGSLQRHSTWYSTAQSCPPVPFVSRTMSFRRRCSRHWG